MQEKKRTMDYAWIYLIGLFAFLIGMPVYLLLSKYSTRVDNADIAFGTFLSALLWPLFLILLAIYKFSVGLRWYKKNVINVREISLKTTKLINVLLTCFQKSLLNTSITKK